MIFNLYKPQEPFKVAGYRVRKVVMSPMSKGPTEVKDKEKTLEGTGYPILNSKRGVKKTTPVQKSVYRAIY